MEDRAEAQSFAQLLQNELLSRCRKNPSYSLRAFSKQLGIDQSLLSKILRGKKPISKKMILELSRVLKIPKANLNRYLEISTDSTERQNHFYILQDQFDLLSDWYHFAILELSNLKTFKSDPKWISGKLGITVSEVNIAIERLIRNEFIKVQKNGKWQIFRPSNDWSNPEITSAARKQYQKQILEKSISAIQNVSYEYRHNSSLTLAINAALIPDIKKMLNKYRDELNQFSEEKGGYTDIYQLSLAFFPLTDVENKRRLK